MDCIRLPCTSQQQCIPVEYSQHTEPLLRISGTKVPVWNTQTPKLSWNFSHHTSSSACGIWGTFSNFWIILKVKSLLYVNCLFLNIAKFIQACVQGLASENTNFYFQISSSFLEANILWNQLEDFFFLQHHLPFLHFLFRSTELPQTAKHHKQKFEYKLNLKSKTQEHSCRIWETLCFIRGLHSQFFRIRCLFVFVFFKMLRNSSSKNWKAFIQADCFKNIIVRQTMLDAISIYFQRITVETISFTRVHTKSVFEVYKIDSRSVSDFVEKFIRWTLITARFLCNAENNFWVPKSK